LQPVAGGLNNLDLDLMALAAQQGGNVVGLPKGELRTAASDAKVHGFAAPWLSSSEF
jgi:hypothetical protein